MLDDVRAVFMPYCLDKQQDGRYAILNREYKPVGFFTKEWIKYADYPVLVDLKGLGPKTVEKLSYDGSSDPNRIYLYDDRTAPNRGDQNMKEYLKRLSILAMLKVS
ncbi:hypothetical protein [Thiocapsa roseopersicina]|uniref:Uncharacterized protein n=1 Tax=Thiocapsa roseopersicina TaxID=1058 RepID=A0A1H2QU22_THIRO|nr:hypothetical protein [Thiocapsa roseopersicina]SDW10370.1 hypothetical protein SAMN05421783_101415 [Thiocapsa roseopersicina]